MRGWLQPTVTALETGRIQAVVLANNTGHVVYERFYAKFGDLDRANIREALYLAGKQARARTPGAVAEACSRFR